MLTLLWCGIMLLSTSTTHVAAWPQLFFWSTALTFGAIGVQLLAMLANVSLHVMMLCVGVLQCAVFYLFSNTVIYFLLSVAIFTLSDEKQKWLHGVLYEPVYAYNENIWVSQLKFVFFTVMGSFGVLLGFILALLLRSVIFEDNAVSNQNNLSDQSNQSNQNNQGQSEQTIDKILDRLAAGFSWGRYLRLHCLGLILFSDCLTRYLTRVCNDADIIASSAYSESQDSHCFFTPLDIPAASDGSSASAQALEYSAFLLLNCLCDVMVEQRFCILARMIATSENYSSRSAFRKSKTTNSMPVQSQSKAAALSQNRSIAVIVFGVRSLQIAVLFLLLLVYMEQRFSFITEYLSVLIVLVVLLTILTDMRDFMALYEPTNSKKPQHPTSRKYVSMDNGDMSPKNANALAFRYDVMDPAHVPNSVFMRPRLGFKME